MSAGVLVVLAEQLVDARQFVESLAGLLHLRSGQRCKGRLRGPGRDDRAHRGAGIAKTERALGDCRQRPGALLGAGRLAENVQPVGDERVFEFEDRGAELVDLVARAPPPGRLGLGEVNGGSLRLNEFGKQAALMIGLGFTGAVAVERRLQVDEPAIEPGMSEARREIADEGRGRPALRQRALGRIVRSVEIDVGHGADQALGPACGRKPDLLARHEFERSVHAEMQHHVGAEILAQVPVEGRKGMRRSEAAIKQQAHGVAFVTHGGLNPDQHVSKPLAQHEQRRAVRLMPARRCAPLRLDLREMRLAPDVIVDIDTSDNIGAGAEARVVALDDPLAQRVDGLGDLDGVAGFLHRLQGAMQRLIDAQECRGARCARVGREVEENDGDLAVRALARPQSHEPLDAVGKARDPFLVRLDVARRAGQGVARPPAKHDRSRRPVEFGNGDHHGRLDRRKSAVGTLPFLDRLKFERLRGDIRHVELAQHFRRAVRIVVGRAADEREPGQRHKRVDLRAAASLEIGFDGRARVEAARERWDRSEPARLQFRDHRVVMRSVVGKHVGPHQQDADGPARAA